MFANTAYTLETPFESPLGRGLSVAVANLSTSGQTVTVTLRPKDAPDQVVTLAGTGDAVSQPGDAYTGMLIEASSYPCTISLAILPGPPPVVTATGSAVAGGTTSATLTSFAVQILIANSFHKVGPVSGQRAILIRANSDNLDPLLVVTDYPIPPAGGMPLDPGETLALDYSGPLWVTSALNVGGSAAASAWVLSS